MRKLLTLLAVLFLWVSAFTQGFIATGKVLDEKGEPVPFASIKVKGTKKGVVGNADGTFSLDAGSADAILVVSSLGFEQREIAANGNLQGLVLKSTGQMQEVVVTGAYNIKRTKRNVSYASQNVNAEQLNTIRQQNVVSALAGKVAGIQMRDQAYTKLGSQPTIRLRGEASFGGSTVLYIVDGTPQNAIDINPDDIEDVTVLKGVNATALFGDRASSGAIVINTKKGQRRKGTGIEINTGVRFDKVYVLPKYQNDYAGGADFNLNRFDWQPGMPEDWKALDGQYYPDYTDDASWGPRMSGQQYIPWYAWYPGSKYSFKTAALVPQPNNIKDFYGTGVTFNNNINFSKAGDDYSIRVSYTNLDVKGLIPNSSQKKNTLNTALTFNLNNHFSVSSNINYVTQNLFGEFADGYSNQSTGSFNSWFHRNIDMGIMKELKDLRAPGGWINSWNHMNPGAYLGGADGPASFYNGNYWFNFYSYFDQINNFSRRDRLVGDVTFTYKVNTHLNFAASVRKNQVNQFFENKTGSLLDPKPNGTALNNVNIPAGYATGQSFEKEDNFELVANYSNKWKDFALNANVGIADRKNQFKSVNMNTSNGLAVPELYSITNSKDPIGYSNGRSQSEVRSMFGRADVGFRNFLFVEATLRNDWFSTLRPEANNILYKSFGGSFVFSDFTSKILPWLDFGKLRASWGEVPTSLGAYATNYAYGVNPNQWSGNILMGTPDRLIDSAISGATNKSLEFGAELRFLRNRLTIDVTYYDQQRVREPLSVALPATSGFSSKLLNVGKVIQKGLEFTVTGKVVQSKNFSWNTTVNFARNFKNEVVEIYPGINRLVVAAGAFSGSLAAFTAHFPGMRWGQMVGYGIKRDPETQKPIVNPSTGLFVRTEDQIKFGSVLPDFTGGFLNAVTYKDFVLNVNIDFQKGGKYYSLSDNWGSFSGLTARTAALNDKGIPVRDPVSNGGGVKVVGLSSTDGTAVEKYVDAQTYFHQFVNNNISETSIFDLDYVKIREVSFGYRIPVKKIGLDKAFQSMVLSIVARNPYLIYNKNRDFDPSEISSVYGEDGQQPGTRSLGFNLKLGF